MEEIRFNGDLNIEIKKPGFIQLSRKANHIFAWPSGKPQFSFLFVQKGRLQFNFTSLKKTIYTDAETGIFIPKNLPYQVTYLQDDTKIKILTFDLKKQGTFESFKTPLNLHSPEIQLIFSSISQKNMYSPLFLSSMIYELLHSMSTITENTIPKKYRKLTPALLELKQQYFKNEKISYYSELCDMSESNFRKLFKEYTGHTPISYRNLIRISAVQALLNTGETTISEAAYLVGFNNMSFFYEVYNKHKTE